MTEMTCDVLIVGASMAGGLLARHLRLEQPDLKIILIDKKTKFDCWVGESSVEAFDDYLCRVLKLGPNLNAKHIVKHGFRFFWDSEKRDLPMDRLAEVGLDRNAEVLNAWQINREVFDADIVEMNRKMGVEVMMGTRLTDPNGIVIDRENGHLVPTSAGPIRCKYLVDAAGAASPLGRKFNLVKKTPLPTSSYWARFENTIPIDQLGGYDWRRRVNFTHRFRSTNHMMYKDYWIWIIPVGEDNISIGVTGDHTTAVPTMKNADDLIAFLRKHRSMNQLLGDAPRTTDFFGLKNFSRVSEKFYSEDRWFLSGWSGIVLDPFLSTGGVWIAMGNRFIVDMIKADRSGNAAGFKSRVKHYDLIMRNNAEEWHERMRLGYPSFGSVRLVGPWMRNGLHGFFYNLLPLSCHDFDFLGMLADAHTDCDCTIEKVREGREDGGSRRRGADRLMDEYRRFIEERHPELYFDQNADTFIPLGPPVDALEFLYAPFSFEVLAKADARATDTYRDLFRAYLMQMAEAEKVPWDEAAFTEMFQPDATMGQTLGEVLDKMRQRPTRPNRPSQTPPAS